MSLASLLPSPRADPNQLGGLRSKSGRMFLRDVFFFRRRLCHRQRFGARKRFLGFQSINSATSAPPIRLALSRSIRPPSICLFWCALAKSRSFFLIYLFSSFFFVLPPFSARAVVVGGGDEPFVCLFFIFFIFFSLRVLPSWISSAEVVNDCTSPAGLLTWSAEQVQPESPNTFPRWPSPYRAPFSIVFFFCFLWWIDFLS